MQIILARHGKPSLQLGAWITPRQMKEWIEHYNQADILLEDIPTETKAIADVSGVLVSSTSRRCLQSAQHLRPDGTFFSEGIFCEADLPYPSWPIPKLPPAAFGVAFRLAWFCGFSANAESLSQATIRARTAAERLIELAKESDSVFLMGHGVMTILIAKHLRTYGWIGPKRPHNGHWQFSIYHAPANEQG
jgi:broad specificity phosphatase PhoE